MSEDPPFVHTGLDFAGSLYFAEPRSGNDSSKAYIYSFKCASTHAVHLELTDGLDVPNFLLVFRKFVAHHGLPATILSDNVKTFKSASKQIQTICCSAEVFQYLSNQRTSWKLVLQKLLGGVIFGAHGAASQTLFEKGCWQDYTKI